MLAAAGLDARRVCRCLRVGVSEGRSRMRCPVRVRVAILSM